MGYACPVCETPQRDGEHLANHLAFTAMLHGDDHEAWLDEHVPEWGELTPDELADRVVDFADEAAYEEVFEDTVHDHAHEQSHELFDDGQGGGMPGRSGGFDAQAARERGGGDLDEEAQEILSEAQAMTEEMYGVEADEANGDDEPGADGTADEGKDA